MRRADSVEICEGAELQLGDLRDGLDDEVHRSTCSDVRRGGDPTASTISLRLVHPFLGDELTEVAFDGIHASVHIGLFEIDHDHIEPCDCATWVMPFPICPEPRTAMRFVSMADWRGWSP